MKSNIKVSSSDPKSDSSLQCFYNQEVKRGLEHIGASLIKLKQEPGNRECLYQIKELAESISDLAMIHGYEGVETIAEKIRNSTDHELRGKNDLDKNFLTKIGLAVTAIRQVMEMEDYVENQITFEKFSEQIELSQKKVQRCVEKLSRNFEQLFPHQLELPFDSRTETDIEVNKIEENEKSENRNLLFDIREVDSILTLVEKSQLESVEN